MTFDQLFNKIYITEQDDDTKSTSSVPVPEDFDDVEPGPVPEVAQEETPTDTSDSTSGPTASTLKDYVFQLEDFAEKLNGVEGTSLQSLVSSLDKPGTPFDGISSRTQSEIVRVSEILLSISEKLKSFIINAIKR